MQSASSRKIILILAFVVVTLVALAVFLLYPIDDAGKIDCTRLTDREISDLWRATKTDVERRPFIECLCGQSWDGSSIPRFNPGNTILSGMSIDQVKSFLGQPDYESSGFLRYSLGASYPNRLNKFTSIGFSEPTRSLCIEFSEGNGQLDQVYIGGQ